MLKTPRRRGTPDDDDTQPPAAEARGAGRRLGDGAADRPLEAVPGLRLRPGDGLRRLLAPLKAAATLATCRAARSRDGGPGALEGPRAGLERCGCDKIVLAADVGGFGAQNGRPWRVLGRALRDFEEVHPLPRRRGADPRAVRRALCNACATIRPGGALIREGRARDDYHLAAADLGSCRSSTRRGDQPPPVPDFTEAPPVTQSPALVFSPRSAARSRSTWHRPSRSASSAARRSCAAAP